MKPFKKIKMFLAMAVRISPVYILLLLLNAAISAGQILVNVILPKYLVDELTGGKDIKILVFWAGAIVISNLLFSFLAKWMKKSMDVKTEYMNNKLSQKMAQKIMNVDYAYLEDPYYLDLKERAVFACVNQSALSVLVSNMAGLIQGTATILSLLAVMFTLGPVLLAVTAVTIILTLLLLKSFSSYQVKFFQSLIPVNRKYNYYMGIGFDDLPQKDIRLYGMGEMLTDRVLEYSEEINNWLIKYSRKEGRVKGLKSLIKAFHAGAAYGYVGLRVLSDRFGARIGLGSFTMYINASIQFTTSFEALIEACIRIFQTLDYLDPFMEFMELPEEKQQGKLLFNGPIENISFDNVTFAYPKSDKIVLDHISFEVGKGEKISVVGLNGAGKTTLIKLVCRLYHPTEGVIRINGHDIFEYDYQSYMKEVAAVFQDFKLFAFSIRENILGEPLAEKNRKKRKNEKPLEENIVENSRRMDKIISEAGLSEKVKELPSGIDTLLGKAYDEKGIEMSGGQSQKVAIARALYKEASLVILDEPTSALDPIAEADIYENFNGMVEDKTAMYISHRMSSSIFCDKILIIDGGKVSDYDTHANLMKKPDSLYYKLFHTQALNYQIH